MKSIRNLLVYPLLMLFAAQALHAGSIKKWVDENGVTHYGKTIPPQYRGAHTELNDRGISIRKIPRAKTPEEIERDQALAALRAEQKKLQEEQTARDRILLSLYRNEDDLIMARDGKIAQLEGQIKLTHKEIRRFKTRLSDFQAAAAKTERAGKNLSDRQRANLHSTQRSIEKSYAIILNKEDEKEATIERYNFDLERFRKLRHNAPRSVNSEHLVDSDVPDLVDTAVRCEARECDRLWDIALDYARQHATTPVDLSADRILVTAPPRQEKDISITVSRLADTKYGGERIFMDVQCGRFTVGREFCRSSEVESIRAGFRARLKPAT